MAKTSAWTSGWSFASRGRSSCATCSRAWARSFCSVEKREAVDRAGRRREVLDRPDPGLPERLALRHAHPRDEQQVAVRSDLGRAVGAAPARGVARVVPGDRAGLALVLVEDRLQPPAALAVDRQQVAHVVQRLLAVAEDETDLRVHGDAAALELVGVGGELQERGDLRVPRELRVVDGVGLASTHEEVGAAVEAAVEERALEHDVGATAQDGEGLLALRDERGLVVGVLVADLDDALAEVGAVEVEDLVLVQVAELGGALEHRVGGVDRLDALQLDVERSQGGELARRGLRQVGGAVDDHVVEQEHRTPSLVLPNLAGGCDTSRPCDTARRESSRHTVPQARGRAVGRDIGLRPGHLPHCDEWRGIHSDVHPISRPSARCGTLGTQGRSGHAPRQAPVGGTP